MVEQRKTRFRFGIATLLVAVLVLAVLFSIWNPLKKRQLSISDFEALLIDSSFEEVAEIVGLPARTNGIKKVTYWIYNTDSGEVALVFRNKKYWHYGRVRNDLGLAWDLPSREATAGAPR